MEHLYEKLPYLGGIDPQAGATTATTDVVDMRYFEKVLFLVQGGAVATSLDFWINESTATAAGTTTGTGTAALASITQFGTADDNKQAIIEVDASDLSDGYRYIRGVIKTAGAATNFAVAVLGHPGRYQPANDYDLASVAQITTP